MGLITEVVHEAIGDEVQVEEEEEGGEESPEEGIIEEPEDQVQLRADELLALELQRGRRVLPDRNGVSRSGRFILAASNLRA